MLDTISSQYDSFIYWRMPIPRLDTAELEGLKMLDTISSQYDSFIYWRMPIPRLDTAELEGLKMLDTISSQYDSFIYWRMPIPRLDTAELEGLGLPDLALYKPKGGLGKLAEHRGSQELSQEEDTLLQFNSFNFWRAPIASISSLDFDLI